MAAAQAAPALAADALCCLGLGFLLGALYDLARFLLGDRRAACFAADVGAYCLAAVLLCSFSASRRGLIINNHRHACATPLFTACPTPCYRAASFCVSYTPSATSS